MPGLDWPGASIASIQNHGRIESSCVTRQPAFPDPHADVTLLIDGQCSVCAKEVRLLRWLDRGRGRLAFVDISSPTFAAAEFGLTLDRAMAEMHAFGSDGALITGMEVFRRAYRAVGWGWVWAPTGWPVLRPLFDAMYRVFARNRVRWFSRCEGGVCGIRAARPASTPASNAHGPDA